MKIIKQEVQAIADLKAGYTLGHADVAILNELARIALASLEAEAVMNEIVIPEPATHRNINEICPPGVNQTLFASGWNASRKSGMNSGRIPPIVKGIDAECMGWNAFRAAMLQGADGNSPVIADGWVVAPKEPTEVMFNSGKLAAGTTKQQDTVSLVYKAMIEAAPDYKVRNEITYNGYLIQEEVKDSIRKKIHSSPDTEKSVLWVMKHRGIYREPEIWIFGVTFNCVGDGDSSISAKAPVNIVNSTFINCDLPKGDIQFISCTLPAEWEGKVNAIDCVFKAAPQQDTSRELFVSVEGDSCSKHPDTQLINHPHRQTASIPPHPVKYCPKCEPGVLPLNTFRSR